MPGRFHPEGPQHPDLRQGERVHTACADNPDPTISGQSMPVTDDDDWCGFSAFTVTALGGLFGLVFSCVQTCLHSGQQ